MENFIHLWIAVLAVTRQKWDCSPLECYWKTSTDTFRLTWCQITQFQTYEVLNKVTQLDKLTILKKARIIFLARMKVCKMKMAEKKWQLGGHAAADQVKCVGVWISARLPCISIHLTICVPKSNFRNIRISPDLPESYYCLCRKCLYWRFSVTLYFHLECEHCF